MPSASSETDVYGLFPEIWPNKYITIFNVKCSDVPHNQWKTIYNNQCTSLHCLDAVTYFLFVHFLRLPHEFAISLLTFNGANAMTHDHIMWQNLVLSTKYKDITLKQSFGSVSMIPP